MELDELIGKYRSKGLLIDTNLLLLFIAGTFRHDHVSQFDLTHRYTASDFDLLVGLIDLFERRWVTPHIVTEVDNLARQLKGPGRPISTIIAALIQNSFEFYLPSHDAIQDERYPTLGVTDCTIIAASREALVLTDDLRLWNILVHLGRDAININHLRTL